jgi:uroporphyrinogen-III synthase
MGIECVIQPAFEYLQRSLADHQGADLDSLSKAGAGALVIFTSPRAVWYGLGQLPADALWQARKAAIGPATAHALKKAGSRVDLVPSRGYSSEALLHTLARQGQRYERIYIVAAPGGRTKLAESLAAQGDDVCTLLAYQSEPAAIDKNALAQLGQADRLVTVWTSGNAMKSLSQRVPPAYWFRICQSEWLVISERLLRLARAYSPAKVHMADGPGNADIVGALRDLN